MVLRILAVRMVRGRCSRSHLTGTLPHFMILATQTGKTLLLHRSKQANTTMALPTKVVLRVSVRSIGSQPQAHSRRFMNLTPRTVPIRLLP